MYLATQYDVLKKQKKIPELQSVVAKLEVKLICKWEETKEIFSQLENETLRASGGVLTRPKKGEQAEEEYVKMKNTLSIIKKLQKKFKLVLS